MTDVLICGAGPAGAIAALVLARAGARVRLIDRARFLREKLCGDTLNPGARHLQAGDRRGGGCGVPLPAIVTGRPVSGSSAATAIACGRALRARRSTRRWGVFRCGRRDRRASSFEVIHDGTGGWRAGAGRAAGAPLDAPLTIAADGAHSRLARSLGLARHAPRPRRWAVGAYFGQVEGMSEFGEMHVRPDSYIGVAPLPDGVANACVVSADVRALARPDLLLDQRLRTDPVLSGRFAHAQRVTRPQCLGPLAVESSACGLPGLLLAGDAAGFIDPMTGDGLRFALRGGELAALEALRALEHGSADAHVRLASARRQEFANKWRFNRALRSLVGSPRAVRGRDRRGGAHHTIRHAGDPRA
jgi:flavin-dependent dehydrogenase